MASQNKIILVGRLTADPEARATVEGMASAKFRLAVDRPGVTQAENGTDLIDIVAWRQLAEFCGQGLKKGQLALVEGRIQNRTYEDQSGQRKWVTEVVAKYAAPLEKSEVQSPMSTGGVGPRTDDSVEDEELSSDLPF